MLQLLVVREGLMAFLCSWWHVCMDCFILCSGRYHTVWETWVTWSGLKFCSFMHNWVHKPLQKLSRPWWIQNWKQICSAGKHESPEPFPQRNCRANFELNCTFRWQTAAQVQPLQKKCSSCLTPPRKEKETANTPTGKESDLVLSVWPYLFGDSMLVDSALQLLQLCSNGSKFCCPHCLTQNLPTVSAIGKIWSL